jgi:hypothetical protein
MTGARRGDLCQPTQKAGDSLHPVRGMTADGGPPGASGRNGGRYVHPMQRFGDSVHDVHRPGLCLPDYPMSVDFAD